MKLVHLTDTHLDHLEDDQYLTYLADIGIAYEASGVDAFIHSGDISNSLCVISRLTALSAALPAPLYFVLGNHDYYYDSTQNVRNTLRKIKGKNVKYLTQSEPIYVADTAIIGHDCWYDARIGNPFGGFALNDWRFIHDFLELSFSLRPEVNEDIINMSRLLADEGVYHIECNIKKAVLNGATKIVVVSHAPPFEELHIFNGSRGTTEAMPWYTCKSLGIVLKEQAEKNPSVDFLTLHGHTHGFIEKVITPNIRSRVGAAEYGKPGIGSLIEF